MRPIRSMLCLATLLVAAGCAASRGDRPAAVSAEPANDVEETTQKAAEIATQPVRDVGIDKPDIPPVLAKATQAPYDLTGLKRCRQLAAAIVELTEVLGPDYLVAEKRENRVGKLAEEGGKTIVNSLIPFRGLIREMTGAAAAQRRYDDAIDAGYARRGFLRGVHSTRKCPPVP